MEINEKRAGKWACLIVFAIFLSFAFTLLFSAAASAGMIPFSVKTTKEDGLNIRVKADTYSDVLTVVDNGTTLYPVSETGNWYEVRFASNLYGYVYKTYVVQGDAFPTKVKLFPGAALRTTASTTGQIDTICSSGTKVSILTQDDTWYYVTANNGEQGYILKSSVKTPSPTYPEIEGADVEVTAPSLLQVTSSAIIRSGAGNTSSKVTTLAAGAILTVVSQSTGSDGYVWYKITTLSGTAGYVRSDLVKNYSLAGKVIVIDPGHGCYKTETATELDNGNVGINGVLEKDVDLGASMYLKAYLKAFGATVIMTRNKDVGVMTLASRAEVANTANADIFISVHCNASAASSSKDGAITYYYGDSISSTLLAKRKVLSTDIQAALTAATGADNLGIASENFTVLVNTTMPSVMVELGYISNAKEEALLATTDYQNLCAQGIYKGILTYFESY